ncbi:ABC transporter substrate-binding protein [Actinomycetospora sp. NBRC 106378]|uniref:ABC transporter substrate-binding protein n=1 Tax=Actinomycetospora sp. NBRC 106378 TaxID=3032208 RepID=UPI0024A0810A|nr:ABC transporter substrate-binding protein [Actinomycetospora sp. NBRC 106378]GLZ53160.1 ABC transporter substrate-binding protein [Actinomycetospora sp. NBRC 106378]
MSRLPRRRLSVLVACAAAAALALTGCSSSSSNQDSQAAKATTVAEAGGMDALVAAAKAEGQLNTITLPANWANYGNIIQTFQNKYGITINNANPDGSSQDEINAVTQLKGQDRAPDVLDLGQSFAIGAANQGLLAPYRVASWDQIPGNAKDTQGRWASDYGGYIAIGYDPARVPVPPTSLKDLLDPRYRNQVGINGDPTQAGAAFAAVYAAALANGGNFDNITPGVDFFKQLKQAGNFVPVKGSAATVQSGQTPILVYWDYLQVSQVQAQVPNYKVTIPTDAAYAAYYSQAINATAPHPAAARLWEEFLYSTEGQNLWLQGAARPILLPTMVANGTVDQAAYAKLPPAPAGAPQYPSDAQQTAAKQVVSQQWAQATGS